MASRSGQAPVAPKAEGGGSFEHRLRAFARAHMEHLFAHAMTVRLLLREVFSGGEQWQRLLIDHVVGDIVRRLRAIFEDGQAQIVPAFADTTRWILEDLWVETEFDTDGAGHPLL